MSKKQKTNMIALRVDDATKKMVEQVAAKLTISRGKRHTLTDVMQEALKMIAKREKVAVS